MPTPPLPLLALRDDGMSAGTTDHDSDKRLCHSQAGLGVWRPSCTRHNIAPPQSSLGQFSRELHCPPQLPLPPQPRRGRRVGGGQRRQWWKCHWRQEGWVLEEMEERSSPFLAWQPGCRAVWFISFQTEICNFPQASGTVEAGGLQGF